jgi:hypothetical protein
MPRWEGRKTPLLIEPGGRVFEFLGAQHISLARLEYFQEI